MAPITTIDRMPPKRVLIVDDQPVFRRVVRDLLTGLRPGLPVLLASTDGRYEVRAQECGARGFVSKSYWVDADLGTLWR